ncbi:GEVED domain-containing protein [Aquimarina sp. 2201CG14-23]|uniref:GEVED domain-containing protein n=1 Tax=Aquimarina mycalae TaxID=3040073 RepID=UPI0024782ACD|nr:GEVED domain-containing protein [Aquimarina sp. 2201CG14-23]MDH7444114.1 GEVED domain-containing protein [Aquimarina sp. 2201CG14-23]
MKNQLVLFMGLFVFHFGFSQTNNFWKKNNNPIESTNISSTKKTSNQNTYHLSVEKFKDVLSHCPNRYNYFGQSNVIITLPTEDGKFKEYRVKETNALHPDLAKKYPDIKSYVGTPVNGENEVVHFSLGHNSLRGMIMKSDTKLVHIKPYDSNSKDYVVTSKTDGSEPINCQIIDNAAKTFSEKSTKQAEKSNKARKDANDGRVRVYRMAIAVTGELSKIYTDKAGVTNGSTQQRKAAVLAELNDLMTRVNAIYERDLGTTFELVPNIENSIFLNGATDGITHGNTSISVNEGQGVLDAAIGNANYDIGHVLDSDGTGRGALRSVCDDSKKAQGATGAHPFTSVADYFFRTFVHEIGHQFGANHSFNNSCGGNRLDEGAVEPGGGNTIMAYTGCDPNTENTQYVFFHAKQIDEMWNHIVSTAGCGTTRSVGNSAPVASVGGNYTIPRSTPFILEGSATDPNTASNQLTYTWNQMDKEIAPMPPRATSTVGPLFRYKPPSTSPNRYMPDLSAIKAGDSSSEWEVTPSVARTMNFRFTVRDNHPGGGNTDSDNAVITVSGTAGPFVITSQNTRFDAPVGSTHTVTWNVAGTTGNGVNAATVDILLSIDGGNTYPITLASAVPNDGSHQITIPDNQGGVNRIMVRGTNNIFFDITNANFSITDGNSDPMPTSYCAAGSQGTNYIDEVIFGAISNKSGNSSYTDFTNLGTNLVKGESVTLTVNPGIDFHDPNYFGAWIDWNKDGDFTDAGEEVLLKTNGPGGVTTTVVVPNTAKNGATRLRVRYKIHTAPEPCGTTGTTGGEVEDYFVFIIGGSANPTCNDGIQNGNETGVDCDGPDCNPCTVDPTCNDGIQNGNETGVDCGGPDCTPCNTSVTYCSAGRQGSNYIAEVTFGSISNTSQNSAYTDFTSQSTNVEKGQSITLTVTPGITSSNWNSNVVGGWIDWNKDGDFEDSGEEVLMKPRGTGSGSATVVVPNNAQNGSTRLRVRYRWFSNPSPCGVTEGDEVEDYTVIVGGTSGPTCTDGMQNGDETGVDCGGSTCDPCQTNVTYCAATGNDGPEGVTNVAFAGINNSSTRNATGYDDFTSISGNVNAGTNYNLRVNIAGYNGGGSDEIYAFFDWNIDGDFTDAGESYTLTKTTALIGDVSVAVPNTATIGTTKMRILVSYYDIENNPCNTGTNDVRYGEYEDYSVVIGEANLKSNIGIDNFNVFPNPFTDTFNIDVSKIKDDFIISVFDISGKELIYQRYNKADNVVALGRELEAAGVYFVKIQADKHTKIIRVVKH